jgi:hypothetical protein
VAAAVHLQVIRARVPLIAFVDGQTGIMVDISVSNHGGTFKSIFTRELSQFDPRFVALYRLVSTPCAAAAHIDFPNILLCFHNSSSCTHCRAS